RVIMKDGLDGNKEIDEEAIANAISRVLGEINAQHTIKAQLLERTSGESSEYIAKIYLAKVLFSDEWSVNAYFAQMKPDKTFFRTADYALSDKIKDSLQYGRYRPIHDILAPSSGLAPQPLPLPGSSSSSSSSHEGGATKRRHLRQEHKKN